SDGNIRCWNTQSGKCVRVQKGHQGAVQSLTVSPDGKTLASCGDEIGRASCRERVRDLHDHEPYLSADSTTVRDRPQQFRSRHDPADHGFFFKEKTAYEIST